MLKKNQKGFTLIELLIVVAIIGILAAIAIPNLLTAMQRSKQKRTSADIRTLPTAVEAYPTAKNAYPQVTTVEEPRPLLAPNDFNIRPLLALSAAHSPQHRLPQ